MQHLTRVLVNSLLEAKYPNEIISSLSALTNKIPEFEAEDYNLLISNLKQTVGLEVSYNNLTKCVGNSCFLSDEEEDAFKITYGKQMNFSEDENNKFLDLMIHFIESKIKEENFEHSNRNSSREYDF
jgi:hypothetical protein